MPIKKIESRQQQPFINLVNQILDAKRANPSADTSALEAEIDLMVYHLYNLTHAEVLLIDPAFGMSEAQYTAAGQSITVS